ncbi:hypothetical protein H112_06224 [Trichophyton rubrum D6]|nr:hypothetical protein H107_06371 [Trichophyton rubrum CBS 202.88]KDB31323.1 hypothetical protein H112_06224 [Trichophyton rubrum D6]
MCGHKVTAARASGSEFNVRADDDEVTERRCVSRPWDRCEIKRGYIGQKLPLDRMVLVSFIEFILSALFYFLPQPITSNACENIDPSSASPGHQYSLAEITIRAQKQQYSGIPKQQLPGIKE